MRRFVVLMVMVIAVASTFGSAAASTLHVRLDANDSSSNLDFHKVITNLSDTTMYLRFRSWDRFKRREMRDRVEIDLDTFGTRTFDRAVTIDRGGRGIVCSVYNLSTGAQLGRRLATRPDPRSAACHLPRRWFGRIDRAVRFEVYAHSLRHGTIRDTAPNRGLYRWV